VTEESVRKKVRDLSGTLAHAETCDFQALADLRTLFKEIARWAEETLTMEVSAMAGAAARLTERIMLDRIVSDEVPGMAESRRVLACTVLALQAIVLERRSVKEVTFPVFPAELLLSDYDAGRSMAE
jgi:hypothetical protein